MPHLADRIISEISLGNELSEKAKAEPMLAISMLKNAHQRHGSNKSTSFRIHGLCDLYCDQIRRGIKPWTEPELFWALSQLNTPECDLVEEFLDLAAFHMGAGKAPQLCRTKYVRSPILHRSIFQFHDDGSLCCAIKLAQDHPVIVPFIPALYADMLSESLYPRVSVQKSYDHEPLLKEAFIWIEQYSRSLSRDIRETVKVIALTGEIERPSFSCRTTYYGGVFINPHYRNGAGIAEAIIHEFLHQKLWLWWAFEPLTDESWKTREIVSPVTGMIRTVEIMLQAAVIYRECLHFYRWLIENQALEASVAVSVSQRVRDLSIGLDSLCSTLKQNVETNSRAARYLEMVQFDS